MEILPLFAFLIVGIIAGLIGGLLGLSGGVITVPALIFIFRLLEFPEVQLIHMAIGTSLAAMIFNGIVSTWSHHKRAAVAWDFVRLMLLWIIIGSLIGSYVANLLSGALLQVVFGIFVLLLGFYLFRRKKRDKNIAHPNPSLFPWLGMGVGSIASLLGIGGGVFTVPLLISYHYPEKKAVGTSAAISLVITVVAALDYLYFGLSSVKIPQSIGYIYLPAFIVVGIGAVLLAPLGAKWANEMDGTVLRKIFAGVLIVVGLLMLYPW